MELRHFRYFVAVAECMSFTGAAARLYVSQPTLSQQIRGLERELGVRLFDRQPDGTRLTAAGLVFYERAQRILGKVDSAVADTRKAAPHLSELRIGVAGPLPDSIHFPVISAFAAAFPQVRLRCQELAIPEYEQPLLTGDIDVAFLRSPLDFDRVVGQPIVGGEPCAIAAPQGHPFWEADSVGVAEFLEQPLVNYSPKISRRPRLFWQLSGERNGAEPQFVGEHAATNAEITLSAGLNKVVIAGPATLGDGLTVSRFKLVELRGGPTCTTYVVRRRDDTRMLPATFCDFAHRIATELPSAHERPSFDPLAAADR
ncbi:LysR family transcriptional regulator [Nocardia aurantia]|uniref:HTH-type transcriptional regulator CynR n=1 Tax=Nocardia aurantia TaxID=2585199 RepID=A0A7K0DZ31_9NOCA|nr:LysR family transcriptional regulator [Nocardia aurantia]MQY30818.1 HTH-type transcriptional regulator CynR [Nocardia aurantia]